MKVSNKLSIAKSTIVNLNTQLNCNYTLGTYNAAYTLGTYNNEVYTLGTYIA